MDHGPVRVKVHPALCEGWGVCHRFAPNVYTLDEDGCVDVHLLQVPAELAEEAWIGASSCPQRAITFIGPPPAYWSELSRRRSNGDASAATATRAHGG